PTHIAATHRLEPRRQRPDPPQQSPPPNDDEQQWREDEERDGGSGGGEQQQQAKATQQQALGLGDVDAAKISSRRGEFIPSWPDTGSHGSA
uniref:Uncharacterized protein n=1 Tax=Aegilops tauschii subsp. strangulata TaxID=200361 RepID=A0A453LSG6_AEGTS